jgi:hypothetical protein
MAEAVGWKNTMAHLFGHRQNYKNNGDRDNSSGHARLANLENRGHEQNLSSTSGQDELVVNYF